MRVYILTTIIILAMITGCSKSPVETVDPLDEIIAGVSFSPSNIIVDMTQPLIISFYLEMVQQSVEDALIIEPAFEYQTHWTTLPLCNSNNFECYPDFFQVYLYPTTSMSPNTKYVCRLETTAVTKSDIFLPHPFEFEFTTDSTRLMKFEALNDIIGKSSVFPITIILGFNTAIELSSMGQPFTSEPVFDYELLSTSNDNDFFEYRITSPLRTETDYIVEADDNLTDIYGNTAVDSRKIMFTTDPVEVLFYYPNEDTNIKSRKPIIQVRFNTVMDHATTEAAFSIESGGIPLSGYHEWLTDKAVLFFMDSELPKGTRVTFSVSTFAEDTYGANLKTPHSYTFSL